jgi:hypothetical protein
MDYTRPALLFFIGVLVASAFFLLGFDRILPRWMRPGHRDVIALAVVPSPSSGANGCPESYAIDNRTDRLVLFTLVGASDRYGPPPSDDRRWNDPSYDRGSRSSSADYGSSYADMTGLTGGMLPDSSEPGVKQSEDGYPDDSNYGGSSPSYGADGSRNFDEGSYYGRGEGYSYRDPNYDNGQGGSAYSQTGIAGNRYADNQGGYQYPPAGGSYAGGRNDLPPPPSGQPVPLTPPDNSSPYGAPNPSPYGGGYGSGYGSNDGYGNGYGYGPRPDEVRPGEMIVASVPAPPGPDGQPQNCDQSGNTVTVQLSND